MQSVTVEELEKIDPQKRVVVDIRPAEQFARGSFPGAINMPMEDFDARKGELDRDRPVFLFCHTGDHSREYVEELSEAGYEAVNVEGGYRAYLKLMLSRLMQENSEDEKQKKREEIERSIIKKYRRTIWRPFTKALNEYQLIREGDHVAVCISGGKDSMLLAKLIQELQRHSKVQFDATFLIMNPGYNGDNWKIIQNNAELLGIPLTVFETEIFDTVAAIRSLWDIILTMSSRRFSWEYCTAARWRP